MHLQATNVVFIHLHPNGMQFFVSLSNAYGSNLSLWYAHYGNNPSFSYFSSFGGWSKSWAKQYAEDAIVY